ncbi:MAG: hypothetical protein IKC03_09860 [Oscillospiraceae bacterium]|nr:hypothetical protein [Oscillospiraceae bacterium]
MKASLTKQQVQMLLDGKKLTSGRRSFTIPKEGEIPDQLKLWLSDYRYQLMYRIIVDTNDLSISFEKRGEAE